MTEVKAIDLGPGLVVSRKWLRIACISIFVGNVMWSRESLHQY